MKSRGKVHFLSTLYKTTSKRYLLSHFLVFLLPFLVLSGVLIATQMITARDELVRYNESSLEHLFVDIQAKFRTLDRTSLEMSLNPHIRNQNVRGGMTSEMISEIARYMWMNEWITNIYVYYDGNETIYSANGTTNLRALFDIRYAFETIDEEAFAQALKMDVPKILVSENYLYYFAPYTYNATRMGRVFYTIPLMNFHRFAHSRVGVNQNASILIGDYVITNIGTDIVGLDIGNRQELERHTDDFLVAEKEDDVLNLQIYSLMSMAILENTLFGTFMVSMSVLLFFLVLGLGGVLFISYRNYQPIAQLDKLYRKISNDEEPKENIVDSISDYLLHQNVSRAQEDWQLKQLKTSLLWERLLHGVGLSYAQLVEEFKAIGRVYQEEIAYCVVVHTQDFSQDMTENLKIKTVVSANLPKQRKKYSIDMVEFASREETVFILQADKSADFSEIQEDFKNYLSYLSQNALNDETIEYGKVVEDLAKLNNSYIDAQVQKQRRTVPLPPESMIFPEQEILTLLTAIQFDSKELITEILADLTRDARMSSESYAYFILNKLLTFAQSHQFTLLANDFQLPPNRAYEHFLDLCLRMASSFHVVKEKKEQALEQEILRILHQKFSDPMFSLEELALHFDVSLSKMSQMVKVETGYSFSKYVQELRIGLAKELLLSTNKPIKVIVEEIGYADLSNFTRKFREVVGCPPGQYRKAKGLV